MSAYPRLIKPNEKESKKDSKPSVRFLSTNWAQQFRAEKFGEPSPQQKFRDLFRD